MGESVYGAKSGSGGGKGKEKVAGPDDDDDDDVYHRPSNQTVVPWPLNGLLNRHMS